jgi:gamma-glutamyltranspeptidase/glutathione hydrolase
MNSNLSNKGIISTTNYHATNAALAILKNSGNAIDAAIAASSVLSVTSQHQCGLGGDLFAMVFKDGRVFALNSSGFSGSKLEEYSKNFSKKKIQTFKDPRLITIPGAVDGWLELHKKFGTKKISDLFKKAIELANDGFECDQSLFNAIEN